MILTETEGLFQNPFERLSAAGDYFADLALALFGGERNAEQNNGGMPADILHWDWEAAIEVKGASNVDPVKIFLDQVERLDRARGFPLSRSWFAIFHYRNQPRRFLCETRSPHALEQFLARRLMALTVIDLRVVKAICGQLKPYEVRRYGERVSAVRFGRRFLKGFLKDPEGVRALLKLSGRSFRLWRFRVRTPPQMLLPLNGSRESSSLPLAFEVNLILPWGHYRRIVRRLRERCELERI